jgi:hypothetical protein
MFVNLSAESRQQLLRLVQIMHMSEADVVAFALQHLFDERIQIMPAVKTRRKQQRAGVGLSAIIDLGGHAVKAHFRDLLNNAAVAQLSLMRTLNGAEDKVRFAPNGGSDMGTRRGFLLGVLLLGVVLALCVYFSRQLLYLAK